MGTSLVLMKELKPSQMVPNPIFNNKILVRADKITEESRAKNGSPIKDTSIEYTYPIFVNESLVSFKRSYSCLTNVINK